MPALVVVVESSVSYISRDVEERTHDAYVASDIQGPLAPTHHRGSTLVTSPGLHVARSLGKHQPNNCKPQTSSEGLCIFETELQSLLEGSWVVIGRVISTLNRVYV